MKILNNILKTVSWISLGILLMFSMVHFPESYFSRYFLPPLTAAAVGYLTNWFAIWLLFRPYQKRWGIQGMIPRNRIKLGKSLGLLISEKLFTAENLINPIKKLIQEKLKNPQLAHSMEAIMRRQINQHRPQLIEFLLPIIHKNLHDSYPKTINAQTVQKIAFYWLDNINAQQISAYVIDFLSKQASDFMPFFHELCRNGTRQYVRAQYPKLCQWINLDEMTEKQVTRLDWQKIERQLIDEIQSPATKSKLQAAVPSWINQQKQWLVQNSTSDQMNQFLRKHQVEVSEHLTQKVESLLPDWIDSLIASIHWQKLIDKHITPAIEAYLTQWIENNDDHIVRQFNIAQQIESSVTQMNAQTLHQALLSVCDEHLCALQILGYFLGALAGIAMVFV